MPPDVVVAGVQPLGTLIHEAALVDRRERIAHDEAERLGSRSRRRRRHRAAQRERAQGSQAVTDTHAVLLRKGKVLVDQRVSHGLAGGHSGPPPRFTLWTVLYGLSGPGWFSAP